MPVIQNNSTRGNSSARRCLGNGLARLMTRLRTAIFAAVREENARAADDAARDEDKDLFDQLPDPPHLEYGEVRYRNGRFNYFDS
jgi:hypothetical protein